MLGRRHKLDEPVNTGVVVDQKYVTFSMQGEKVSGAVKERLHLSSVTLWSVSMVVFDADRVNCSPYNCSTYC